MASLYVKLVIALDREITISSYEAERESEHNVVYKKTQDVGRVWRVGVWVLRS